MKLNNMKKIFTMTLIIFTIVILAGCGSSKEKEVYTKDLKFLERGGDNYGGTTLIFESEEDRKYYLVKVDNYYFDNIDFEVNEVVEFDATQYKYPYLREAREKILIGDEWKYLHVLTEYTKK